MSHSTQANPRIRILIATIAVVLLLIGVAWMGGMFIHKISPEEKNILMEYSANSDGELFTVTSTRVPLVESVPASLSAKQTTLISSRILARITAIKVRSGDVVKKDQLLIQLEKSDLEARAKQSAEQARSIQAKLTEAEQNLSRMNKLFKDGLVAKAEQEKAIANQQSLSADLSGAQLALKDAQTSLSYTDIRSPIDGRVVDRFAEPGDTATPGSNLLSLYNPSSLRVEAQVRETLAIRLNIGDPVTVEIPTFKKSIPAFVEEIVPAANPNSRSFSIKVSFEFDATLLPGMYARVLLPIGEEDKLLIPETLVAQMGQLDVVWVLNGKQVERRFIKLGNWKDDGKVEVVSGLTEGDEIIPIPAGHMNQ